MSRLTDGQMAVLVIGAETVVLVVAVAIYNRVKRWVRRTW